jgi:hypothetical protein
MNPLITASWQSLMLPTSRAPSGNAVPGAIGSPSRSTNPVWFTVNGPRDFAGTRSLNSVASGSSCSLRISAGPAAIESAVFSLIAQSQLPKTE